MEKINSLQNVHVKAWKKLQTKKGRKQQGYYLLDGWHLVNEAVKAKVSIKTLLITGKQLELKPDLTHFPAVIEISDEVASHISATVTPQGVFALAVLPKPSDDPLATVDLSRPWLLLDNVQDPGNIGTMVRTADAAGFGGVAFGTGTVDIHQPKVERAMQGSQFHLQLISTDLRDLVKLLQAQGKPVYGSELNPEAAQYLDVKAPASFGLIMGNEGNGMSDDLLALTDQNLYIPLKGQAESLNVAIAAGILMFGLYR
ncbi:RNA methyltransferase [Lactiplantibacillus sp. WILCCON 0030]|uniref:RNA methyltransferase n=1 Tax=Lactiplantibacillus brownii TaxID=3069269 RepID=A0ABU1A8C2_9LACO|nr:RNA methyltransferase [Lactiplantibacillus brownii]MDQ7937217.1 RNA methyltransferase [Lactiplantibacillus brownii]